MIDLEKVNLRNKERNENFENYNESPEIKYLYRDSDNYIQEISELYTYSEESEYKKNKEYFYEYFGNKKWLTSKLLEKDQFLHFILDKLEQKDNQNEIKILRSLLYLCQGNFDECRTSNDLVASLKFNSVLLYKRGLFCSLIKILFYEIQKDPKYSDNDCHLETNQYLRIVLSILYSILETLRSIDNNDTEYIDQRKIFLENIINNHISDNENSLVVCLFTLLNKFCSISSPHIPVRKVLLLLWKIILFVTDGTTNYTSLKRSKAIKLGISENYLPFCGESPQNASSISCLISAFHFDGPPFPFSLLASRRPPTCRFDKVPSRGPLSKTAKIDSAIEKDDIMNEINDQADASIDLNPSLSIDFDEPSFGLNDIDSDVVRTLTRSKVVNVSKGKGFAFEEELVNDIPKLGREGFASSMVNFIDLDKSDQTFLNNKGSGIFDDINNDNADEESIDESNEDEMTIILDEKEPLIAANQPKDSIENAFNLSKQIESGTPFHFTRKTDDLPYTPHNISQLHVLDDAAKHSEIQIPDLASLNDKKLPWKSKVRNSDILEFLNKSRHKFLGFTLPNDSTTLTGLPRPIHESYQTLKNHLYIPISEIEIELENKRSLYPYTFKEKLVPQTIAEMMYESLLPNMTAYLVSLLKILLAASPTSKAKTESINIKNDVLPKEINAKSQNELLLLESDIKRHKSIVAKTVSGILFLLLKHFKVNHIYQFEYCCQLLSSANCVPLILKYFNQDIHQHITIDKDHPYMKFPNYVLNNSCDRNSLREFLDSIEDMSSMPIYHNKAQSYSKGEYSWANLFTCINLARILNMLIKGKQTRIMMLVVFGSAPILRKALKVKEITLQYYLLKLLKLQMKYLGRQWRKNNMRIVSAIYQCVRHHLNDDWAYGNYNEIKPRDFHSDEAPLKVVIEKFHLRRYPYLFDSDNTSNKPIFNIKNGLNDKEHANDNREHISKLVNEHCGEMRINTDDKSQIVLNNLSELINKMKVNKDVVLTNPQASYIKGSHRYDDDAVNIFDTLKAVEDIELTSNFKKNYEKWLEREVFGMRIEWDKLLDDN